MPTTRFFPFLSCAPWLSPIFRNTAIPPDGIGAAPTDWSVSVLHAVVHDDDLQDHGGVHSLAGIPDHGGGDRAGDSRRHRPASDPSPRRASLVAGNQLSHPVRPGTRNAPAGCRPASRRSGGGRLHRSGVRRQAPRGRRRRVGRPRHRPTTTTRRSSRSAATPRPSSPRWPCNWSPRAPAQALTDTVETAAARRRPRTAATSPFGCCSTTPAACTTTRNDEDLVKASSPISNRVWQPQEGSRSPSVHPPTFAPGTSWEYSNTNYILAGMILEKVTGIPAAELIARRITRPLHLAHTYLPVGTASTDGPRRAHAYMVLFATDGTRSYLDAGTSSRSWAGTAGAVISTPRNSIGSSRPCSAASCSRPRSSPRCAPRSPPPVPGRNTASGWCTAGPPADPSGVTVGTPLAITPWPRSPPTAGAVPSQPPPPSPTSGRTSPSRPSSPCSPAGNNSISRPSARCSAHRFRPPHLPPSAPRQLPGSACPEPVAPGSAETCRNLPQPAATCRNLPQPVATCRTAGAVG